MLTEVCQYLKNWFDRNQPKYYGQFEISNNVITSFNDGSLENGYIRIIGSRFNDGVVNHGEDELESEVFEGAVWIMALPPAVVTLASDIQAWREKYEGDVMSPFSSESFGGYSYSKGASGEDGWQTVFGKRLSAWRKI